MVHLRTTPKFCAAQSTLIDHHPCFCGRDKLPTPEKRFLAGTCKTTTQVDLRLYDHIYPIYSHNSPSALGQCGIYPRDIGRDISWRRKCSMNKAVLSNGYCEHAATTRQPARKSIAVLYVQWPFIGLLLCGKWKSPCICCSGLFG